MENNSDTDLETLLNKFDEGNANVDIELVEQLAKLVKRRIKKSPFSGIYDPEQYDDITQEIYAILLETRGQVRTEPIQTLIDKEINESSKHSKKILFDSEKVDSAADDPKTYVEQPFLFGGDDSWRLVRVKICTDAGKSLEPWAHFFLHMIARKRYFGWAVPRIKSDLRGKGDHGIYHGTPSPHILEALRTKQRSVLNFHDSRTEPERLLIEIMVSTFAILRNITARDRRFGYSLCPMIFDGASVTLEPRLTARRKIWNKTLDDMDVFCRKLLRAQELVGEDQFLPKNFDASESICRARAFFRAYESSPPWFQKNYRPEMSADDYVLALIEDATRTLKPVRRQSRQRILELGELEYRHQKTYSEIVQLGELAVPGIIKSIQTSRDRECITRLLTMLEHMGERAKLAVPHLAKIVKARKTDTNPDSQEILYSARRTQRYLLSC